MLQRHPLRFHQPSRRWLMVCRSLPWLQGMPRHVVVVVVHAEVVHQQADRRARRWFSARSKSSGGTRPGNACHLAHDGTGRPDHSNGSSKSSMLKSSAPPRLRKTKWSVAERGCERGHRTGLPGTGEGQIIGPSMFTGFRLTSFTLAETLSAPETRLLRREVDLG